MFFFLCSLTFRPCFLQRDVNEKNCRGVVHSQSAVALFLCFFHCHFFFYGLSISLTPLSVSTVNYCPKAFFSDGKIESINEENENGKLT